MGAVEAAGEADAVTATAKVEAEAAASADAVAGDTEAADSESGLVSLLVSSNARDMTLIQSE